MGGRRGCTGRWRVVLAKKLPRVNVRSSFNENVIRNEDGKGREAKSDLRQTLNKNVIRNEHWGRREGQV